MPKKANLNHMLFLAAVFLLSAAISGCRTSKKLFSSKKKITFIDTQVVLDSLKKHEIEFHTASIKFNAKYSSDKKSNDFKGTMRIKKDSLIWISFSPGMGIEVARAFLTPDSVKFINRLNASYFVEDYKFFMKKFNLNIDFYTLQSILLNKLFVYPFGNEKAAKSFTTETDSAMYCMKKVKNKDFSTQEIYVNPDFYRPVKLSLKQASNKRMYEFKYSNFQNFEEKLLPRTFLLVLQEQDKNFSLKMNFLKASFNKKYNFTFRIPKKYQPSNQHE